jgi:hypothetical protein
MYSQNERIDQKERGLSKIVLILLPYGKNRQNYCENGL